ncbi:complement regulator-acquiring protein (plasmid) [Borreliella finlandensis]|uniref:complement regulator-acquiring protein n=1 Tax=Borreliella finlandensis TaxID=498741 RepID=UPI002646FF03|nr:complement regulator-acquiring protein [Borreliella finlandensis]WKC89544.1 complement regulator-acquiring protein [Borreliella finlandensis]
MTKFKLGIIRLSAIAAILALIFISCANNPIDPKVNGYANVKEDTENLKNETGNFASENQEERKDAITKLKKFGKELEDQKEKEDAKMPKDTKDNLADDLGIYPMYYGKDQEAKEKLDKAPGTKFTVVDAETQKTEKLKIERIIQASLNYEEVKIKKLKEILKKAKGKAKEKVEGKDDGEYMIRNLLYGKALDIQTQIDSHLESTKDDKLKTLSLENLKELLIHVEFDLMLKEKFKKALKKTVEEVPQEIQKIEEIKEDDKKEYIISQYIISHIAENYPIIFDYSTHNAKSKQKKFDELKAI